MTREVVTRRVERLWAAKTRFLEWLERRVGTRADAEDVLLTSLLQVIAKADTLRDEERLVPWFVRILRHASVDHHRRRAAIARAEQRAAAEMKRMGELMKEMGQMMGGMGAMGGGRMGPMSMPEMSKMMERMAEMHKRMAEMMGRRDPQ